MSGDRRITLQMPPQEAFNEIFMCSVCVCVFVWVAKGVPCACTWPAALLKLRSKLTEKEQKFEEWTFYSMAEHRERRKICFARNIRGDTSSFYSRRSSRWYRGSERRLGYDSASRTSQMECETIFIRQG